MTTRAHSLSLSILVCVIAAAMPASAYAQDYQEEVMEKLYAKLTRSPGIGTGAAGKSILILANPGIPIDSSLDPDTSQDDRRVISRVLDHVPGPGWIYQEMPYGLSQVYDAILQYRQVPTFTMSTEDARALQGANAVLFKNASPAQGDSAKVKAYKLRQAAYYDAVNAAESHRTAGGSVPQQYLHTKQLALQAWISAGYKDEVEQALAQRTRLGALDPNIWFEDLANTFAAARESPGTPNEFEPVRLVPSLRSWSQLNWTAITLSSDEIHSSAAVSPSVPRPPTLKIIGRSMGAQFKFGAFAGGFSESTDTGGSPAPAQPSPKPTTPISGVTLEVLRVGLDRTWLNGLVFSSKLWRWTPNTPLASNLISDGATPPGSVTKDILMPYVPTAILISRNVRLAGSFAESDVESLKLHASGGATVSIGPFTIGGRYQEDPSKPNATVDVDQKAISIPGYQIIGWYCEVLPKLPDPDLADYQWP